LSYKVYD